MQVKARKEDDTTVVMKVLLSQENLLSFESLESESDSSVVSAVVVLQDVHPFAEEEAYS